MRHYFTFEELVTTDTGLPNYPSVFGQAAQNLRDLRVVLTVLRGLVGSPITVTSAYRSEEVNKAVKGVSTSNHLFGRAADITTVNPLDFSDLLDYCMKLYDSKVLYECIYYPQKNIIHISI